MNLSQYNVITVANDYSLKVGDFIQYISQLFSQVRVYLLFAEIKLMNFFGNDLSQGLINMMGVNKWGVGNAKDQVLRQNLQTCTYPDQTKYQIQKAVKQVLHVYPFFNPEILPFVQGGYNKRYIELRGILQVDIKGKTCKIDFNMMLPFDYPRSSPNVRIVNRNPEYIVDAFYKPVQSKTDPSSYILNTKLESIRNWHPSSSLVNVVIESYDLFKTKFPFSKPVAENKFGSGGNNAWDSIYQKKPSNNSGFNNNNNVAWGNNNNNGWGNSGWGNNGWANNNGSSWGNNVPNNSWGNPTNVGTGWADNANTNNWGPNINNPQNLAKGGMGGIISGANINTSIESAKKLVQKQKGILQTLNGQYSKVIDKNQNLDIIKKSLDSEESYLRNQNFEMANFLKVNQSQPTLDMSNIVQPKDELSEQILNLISSTKARYDCVVFLQNKFSEQAISLEDFMKQLRKIEESRFEEKYLLQKCVMKMSS